MLWLDAQDPDGDGDSSNIPPDGAAVRRWADKSGCGNHAVQDEQQQAPTYAVSPAGCGRNAVRFHAASRQFLSVTRSQSLDLKQLAAFVVARASTHPTDMWLFGKNCFTGPWTGYGVAVEKGSTAPWPHLGLGRTGAGDNGYLRFQGHIRDRFAIVEVSYDGRLLSGLLDGQADRAQAPVGEVRFNERNLLVGASPQNLPATQFFDGFIAEILLYKRVLSGAERQAAFNYLAKKYALERRPRTTGDSQPLIIERGPTFPILVQNPATPVTRTLSPQEAEEALERDWLFQAMDVPLAHRGLDEVGWARQLAGRLGANPAAPDLSANLRELDRLERELWRDLESAAAVPSPKDCWRRGDSIAKTFGRDTQRETSRRDSTPRASPNRLFPLNSEPLNTEHSRPGPLPPPEDRAPRGDSTAASFARNKQTGCGARELYFAVRRVKRRIMFANPILDFDQLAFIDQPYPQGGEWKHQAVHRLGCKAVPGGRLLTLDGLHPGGKVRRLAPNKPGAFWRPDVSFDGKRVFFCYKAHDEQSFHLYEISLDGAGLRQITFGPYDDIDPIYAPDGRIAFTTTRGNTYVRCGPYIYSYALARCDLSGDNLYLISTNSEPDFVPALTPDGRIVYSRWEYTDKDLMRIQSL